MDDECIRHGLERSAQVLLASPDVVTPDQRREAEQSFLSFHRSSSPYAICKHLLESSKNDYVLFQAASTLHEALIREWSSLDAAIIESVRLYLMHYTVQNTSLQSYVREQIVQTIAIIHKRMCLDRSATQTEDLLFTDIARLVHTGSQAAQLIACSILSALLGEYSSSSRTCRMGLTWEQHNKCKLIFEHDDMKQVLLFSIQTLSALQKCSVDQHMAPVVSRLLGVVEQIFSWEFTQRCIPRRHVGSFVGCQAVSFKPPASWKDIILDKGLIDMLFGMHRQVRDCAELCHQSLSCISQLASTNGTVFTDNASHVDYLHYFVRSLLNLVSSETLRRHEALDVANVIYNMITFCPLSVVDQLPADVLSAFLSFVTHITCDFCRAASNESERNDDDAVYFEAFDKVLESWMKFVSHVDDFPSNLFRDHAIEIVNVYIHCHLAEPDGSRTQTGEESDQELDELDDDDQDKFSYQLLSVGSLARLVPEYSIRLLTMLLDERIRRLEEALHLIQQQHQTLNNSLSHIHKKLDVINEDLHWLLLISADILADCTGNGETACMPSAVVRCSPSTLSGTMTSLLHSASSETKSVQSTEPVVGLIASSFRLCSVERIAISSGLVDHVSPQVGRSLVRLLWRWSHAYLLPDLSCFEQLGRELNLSLRRSDEQSLRWTVGFLLDHVMLNLTARGDEQDLINDTLQLFTGMVDRKERCDMTVKCDMLWKLAHEFSSSPLPFNALSPSNRRQLCRVLVIACAADFSNGQKETYIQLVLQSIQDRLKAITNRADLRSVCHEETVKSSVLSVLDCLCSVAEASRADNSALIFQFLFPATVDIVALLDLYHNYDEIVQPMLQLFNIIAIQLACYLNEKDSVRLYEVSLAMMQTFAKHNIGRRNLSKGTEEEQFAAILTLMEVLTNLLSKDFLSFASDENEDGSLSTGTVCAADVVLYGLNVIVPLMTTELLKFPALFTAYAALLAYMAEIHASRLCRLPDDLLQRLMAAVELGLTSDAGSDITKACLELVASLASHVCADKTLHGTMAHRVGAHFLEVIFNMLLLDTFDMDLFETAATAFFALICCHEVCYQELVHKLLAVHTNSCYYQRLVDAFNTLSGTVQSQTMTRTARIQFMQTLEHFMAEVRGFLCVR